MIAYTLIDAGTKVVNLLLYNDCLLITAISLFLVVLPSKNLNIYFDLSGDCVWLMFCLEIVNVYHHLLEFKRIGARDDLL